MDKDQMTLPVCLIIMDGYGLATASPDNAISLADKPHLDAYVGDQPATTLRASGEAVGLPEGQMGNSEVGHLNIGAGRVVYQELTRINRICRSGMLLRNPVLYKAMSLAVKKHKTVHLMGLLSDGGVHSSNEHLYALIRLACGFEAEAIRIHCFLDGRDVPPKSGINYLDQLEDELLDIANEYYEPPVKIASIGGRYYAMDRDSRYDRVSQAYHTMVCPQEVSALSPRDAIRDSYEKGITDEFMVPVSFDKAGIQDGDTVIFFNFRPDRAREISRAFTDPAFTGFERRRFPEVNFVCLTEYDPTIPAPVAFPKEFPENVLADVLASRGLRQYHIAETEKYAHVTFFFNGGREDPKEGEERELIPSPKVATYDLQPEMSAPLVTEALVNAITADKADVYIVNYANCDMVGHTGVLPAAISAVEAVDRGVGRVVEAMKAKNGVVLITADHGNADKMVASDGTPHTAHTTAFVPLSLLDFSGKGLLLQEGCFALCNISPTILAIIGIEKPVEMEADGILA